MGGSRVYHSDFPTQKRPSANSFEKAFSVSAPVFQSLTAAAAHHPPNCQLPDSTLSSFSLYDAVEVYQGLSESLLKNKLCNIAGMESNNEGFGLHWGFRLCLTEQCCCPADEPVVHRHAAALLTALLHSLSSWLEEGALEEGQLAHVGPVRKQGGT